MTAHHFIRRKSNIIEHRRIGMFLTDFAVGILLMFYFLSVFHLCLFKDIVGIVLGRVSARVDILVEE
jgi:hypothetical protein